MPANLLKGPFHQIQIFSRSVFVERDLVGTRDAELLKLKKIIIKFLPSL
jgi:hypothetical protein